MSRKILRGTSRPMRVGFIGLNRTGRALAARLIDAGHRLTLFDPARELLEQFDPVGATIATGIEDACRWADAVFTMLPDDEAAEAVILGPGGIVDSLPRDAVHIGSSTVSVECSDRFVEAHWNAGKRYLSAPVLVDSEPAARERLLVIAGGREATIMQMEPLLTTLGQLTRLSGWPSDANLVQQNAGEVGAMPFQFLARHPELCARQLRSQLAFPESPVARFLDIEIKGVLQ